jgi:transposase
LSRSNAAFVASNGGGATHFLTKTLPKVAAEMALSVMAYNLTRVMNIVGIKPLMAAIVA